MAEGLKEYGWPTQGKFLLTPGHSHTPVFLWQPYVTKDEGFIRQIYSHIVEHGTYFEGSHWHSVRIGSWSFTIPPISHYGARLLSALKEFKD